jgi:predicted phage terminase large subunit-like protein
MSNEDLILKQWCESDLLNFTRYIFKENHNKKFKTYDYLQKVSDCLMRVINGEITRLIINIPPRYGKTELAVKNFIAFGLALNPYSKFIHLSYSDDLALDNSSQTKEYIQSESFQKLWSMQLKRDAQGKKKWFNEFGGGVYATASGGAVTGFGAGVSDSDIFSGAIIIDDPLKPDDAFSEVKRKTVNDRYNNTIRSRVNSRDVPIIVIMQRLHEEDLSGFLLDGGSGEDWVHLCLPVIDEDNNPLCEEKHNKKELEQMRKANSYTFAGQYMQTPAPEEGGEWKKSWFEIINKKDLPKNIIWTVYIDGAYTKDTANDPTGIQIGAKVGNDYVIYSSIDKYLELPELIKFIPSYLSSIGLNIRILKVEPKASGKSIVQLIRSQTNLNITEIRTDFVKMSKIECARMSSPYIEGGRVKLVEGNWNEHFLSQVGMFPNAKHDEHVDLTCYGIEDNLMNNFKIDVR